MANAVRVLLVEDSEEDAALVSRALARAGFAVEERRVDREPALRRAAGLPFSKPLADDALRAFLQRFSASAPAG